DRAVPADVLARDPETAWYTACNVPCLEGRRGAPHSDDHRTGQGTRGQLARRTRQDYGPVATPPSQSFRRRRDPARRGRLRRRASVPVARGTRAAAAGGDTVRCSGTG